MRYIDFHCDTITELKEDENLKLNNRHINLQGLRNAKVLVQCCSIFIPTGLFALDERSAGIDRKFQEIYIKYEKEMSENKDELRKILSYKDVEKSILDGKTGILLTIEDGGVIQGSIKRLEDAYEKGVRLITLTWNHENEIGYPNSDDKNIMSQGLKSFGFEMLSQMKKMNMIADVSHLSDGGFWDVMKYAKESNLSVIASHSDSRAVCNNKRNMTDGMIREMAEAGGVVGLNFAAQFLNESMQPENSVRISRIDDMVRHVMHIYSVGGSDVLAIGSDFDGIEADLEIGGPQDMYLLYDALHTAGLSYTVLDKMWQKNGLRVLKGLK